MTAKRFTRDEHTGYIYDNGEIVEDVDEDLMMEYIRIVGRTIDE